MCGYVPVGETVVVVVVGVVNGGLVIVVIGPGATSIHLHIAQTRIHSCQRQA